MTTTRSPADLPGTSPWRRRLAAGLTASVALLSLGVTIAPVASAAACTSPVKYSSSSNTIYLLTAQTWTLSAIKAVCPQAPLSEVDPANQVWELDGNLVLNNGATLSLHGSTAPTPGDVNTFRLRSLASNLATEVSAITAHWGTIDADAVSITSWDSSAGAPDTDPTMPTGSDPTNRGRAFIRAQSYVDGATGRVSTMTFNSSTVANLGYYAAESYGVSWKSEGCSHSSADYATCGQAPVTGGARYSTFTGDFMGTYVWGGHNMAFTNNSFDHNVMYGLDTHDVTTYLDVENNHFSYNGDHGFICSQRCDHLSVISNESDHNGMVPWAGPTPTGDGQAGQVHGIMLHRGVTNTLVARNNVHDQPNGAGIAVFDTSGDDVSDNKIDRALYGIRISVGSAANTFTNNTVTNSIKYGLYTYKGSDVPAYTTPSGHPTNNVFTGNSFTASGVNPIKLGETDGTMFDQDIFGGGTLKVDASAGTRINGGVSNGERVAVTGKSAEPTDVTVAEPTASLVAAIADSYSSIDVTSSVGGLYLVAKKPYSATVTPRASDVHLTLASIGTTSGTTVAPTNVRAVTNSGTATASAWTTTTGAKQISVTPAGVGQLITITFSGLLPSHTYIITGTTAGATTATTDASGILAFIVTPGQATIFTITAS